jgi:O-antigen/teichoic acid export membrane protein
VLPLASLFFILAGLESTSRFILQKRIELRKLAKFEVATALFALVVHIGIAAISPTIWGLIVAGLISSAIVTIGTHFLVRDIKNKVSWNSQNVRDIIHFGKWVFLSSILYFLAINLDRLYLAKYIPLAALGVYGIARSFSDMLTHFVTKVGNLIVFPLVAASHRPANQIREQLSGPRSKLIFGASAGVAVFAASSDLLIKTLYDDRYHEAAAMLPILTIGVWFSILATMGESILLGLGKPAYGAAANALKLAALTVGLAMLLPQIGVIGAAYAVALAEAGRYAAVAFGQWREKMLFIWQDLSATIVAAGTALS